MDFETFTRERIRQLRAEADALDTLLNAYGGGRRGSGVAAAAAVGTHYEGTRAPRDGSAFAAILTAVDHAGAEGLDLDGMLAAAAVKGFNANRNTVRSQVWSATKKGQLVNIGVGRYRLRSPDDEVPQVGGDMFVDGGTF